MNNGVFSQNNTQPPNTDKVLPLFSLKGKTAIVSGAGAGIGLAVAQGLAEAGANTAILFNSNKSAHDRASEIEKMYGVKCRAYNIYISIYKIIFTMMLIPRDNRQSLPTQRHRPSQRRHRHRPDRLRIRRPSRHLRCQFGSSLDPGSGHQWRSRTLS